jgi:hypothetical protein
VQAGGFEHVHQAADVDGGNAGGAFGPDHGAGCAAGVDDGADSAGEHDFVQAVSVAEFVDHHGAGRVGRVDPVQAEHAVAARDQAARDGGTDQP